ncbi:unnamed protein product [Thelazia callipaeda]|uniref:PID domain-containing protein n=1 Tax=Thelazia callipaeda TaxID=103827 RepID=A0A0N5CMQ2_THECL|nr:unnamed protein product [Thelazia callipaeda]
MSVIDNILDPDTFSEYFFYENRLKTFTKKGKFQWPHRNLANLSPVKVELLISFFEKTTDSKCDTLFQMAQAGFFFDPDKDNIDSVTCPFCLKGLARWEEGDDPFVEHNKRKEVCYFMRLNKDEKDWTVEDFLHLVAQRRAAVIVSLSHFFLNLISRRLLSFSDFQISYLGCAKIENPSNESEILKIMQLLNKERSEKPIDVVLFIPDSSFGIVRMCDGTSKLELVSFPVHRIRFCARGQLDSAERECFALSFTQKNATAADDALHQCHVFRCQVPEAAGKALLSFANAFRSKSAAKKIPSLKPRRTSHTNTVDEVTSSLEEAFSPHGEEDFQFDAFLEMREEDSKKGHIICPQEKNCFKLRRDREKRVVVVLQQTRGERILIVKKCFGLLLGAGRNLRHSDMHLLDMQSMGRGNDAKTYIVEAVWDPHLQNLEVLNTETPRETRVFMTVAVDVILTGIDEPVRFNIECKARIFHEHERFWYVSRRPVVEKYFLSTRVR